MTNLRSFSYGSGPGRSPMTEAHRSSSTRLLLALIAVVCIGAISFIGTSASSKYSVYDNCVAWAGRRAERCRRSVTR